MTYACERVCQYACDVGVPEYSGITDGKTCGNCAHYAPDCRTPECTSPATTERRVGHVRAEDGDTWEACYQPMCRGCASDHDMEVALKGWGK